MQVNIRGLTCTIVLECVALTVACMLFGSVFGEMSCFFELHANRVPTSSHLAFLLHCVGGDLRPWVCSDYPQLVCFWTVHNSGDILHGSNA